MPSRRLALTSRCGSNSDWNLSPAASTRPSRTLSQTGPHSHLRFNSCPDIPLHNPFSFPSRLIRCDDDPATRLLSGLSDNVSMGLYMRTRRGVVQLTLEGPSMIHKFQRLSSLPRPFNIPVPYCPLPPHRPFDSLKNSSSIATSAPKHTNGGMKHVYPHVYYRSQSPSISNYTANTSCSTSPPHCCTSLHLLPTW